MSQKYVVVGRACNFIKDGKDTLCDLRVISCDIVELDKTGKKITLKCISKDAAILEAWANNFESLFQTLQVNYFPDLFSIIDIGKEE
jgi:hypothetical protein